MQKLDLKNLRFKRTFKLIVKCMLSPVVVLSRISPVCCLLVLNLSWSLGPGLVTDKYSAPVPPHTVTQGIENVKCNAQQYELGSGLSKFNTFKAPCL